MRPRNLASIKPTGISAANMTNFVTHLPDFEQINSVELMKASSKQRSKPRKCPIKMIANGTNTETVTIPIKRARKMRSLFDIRIIHFGRTLMTFNHHNLRLNLK